MVGEQISWYAPGDHVCCRHRNEGLSRTPVGNERVATCLHRYRPAGQVATLQDPVGLEPSPSSRKVQLRCGVRALEESGQGQDRVGLSLVTDQGPQVANDTVARQSRGDVAGRRSGEGLRGSDVATGCRQGRSASRGGQGAPQGADRRIGTLAREGKHLGQDHPLQPGGEYVIAGTGLGEHHIEGHDARAELFQSVCQVGYALPRPGPGTHFPQALLVDVDQDEAPLRRSFGQNAPSEGGHVVVHGADQSRQVTSGEQGSGRRQKERQHLGRQGPQPMIPRGGRGVGLCRLAENGEHGRQRDHRVRPLMVPCGTPCLKKYPAPSNCPVTAPATHCVGFSTENIPLGCTFPVADMATAPVAECVRSS